MTADQAARIVELCAKVCDERFSVDFAGRACAEAIRALIGSPELAEITDAARKEDK